MTHNNHQSSIINHQSAKRPLVVLGLGNPLMGDEGIGVYLVEELAKLAIEYPSVDFLDVGTGGLSVLHYLEGRRKAILIDCAFMDEEPGAIRRFTPDQVRSRKVLAHQSLHEADLMQILALARQLGQEPERVILFGIQPERVELGTGLSATLTDRVDEYVSVIRRELES
jgi:hydrogenase maturation protease